MSVKSRKLILAAVSNLSYPKGPTTDEVLEASNCPARPNFIAKLASNALI